MAPKTRSASRSSTQAKSQNGEPPAKTTAGSKRKADSGSSRASKRGKKATTQKKQETAEEAKPNENENDVPENNKMKVASVADKGAVKRAGKTEQNGKTEAAGGEFKSEGDEKALEEANKDDQMKEEPAEDPRQAKKELQVSNNVGDAVKRSPQREKAMPSNILEKGIIYFFSRGRVSVDKPESVADLQRTHFVLHPLPAGAKIGDGAIEGAKNIRLFVLPKKAFPKKRGDRVMAFVEKSNTSIKELKDTFFPGSEYNTQTRGSRHTPPVTPIGEGVYAFTKTNKGTHLAYMLTIPSEIGEVQEDIGLRPEGSFYTSVKNPERPGPPNARLPQGPKYPREILEEFRGLAWVDVKPNYLDHDNVQILLIGEGTEGDVSRALDPSRTDVQHDKETPLEEMQKLEREDGLRVEHLNGDDSIFDDLKISRDEYPKVPTTW